MREPKIKTGDTIKCSDADDLVEIMTELKMEGYTTDFLYEVKGVPGYYLEILKAPRRRKHT